MHPPIPTREIIVVSCTVEAKERTALFTSLERLPINKVCFIEHNRRGLSECYNEFLDTHAGSDAIALLVHDDVTIADTFITEKLTKSAQAFNVVGLVGATQFDLASRPPNYNWTTWPREALSGSIEHVVGDGMTDWFRYGPTPQRCALLDGVFLALDLRTIGRVRFDPQFRFHLYDLDFCLSAHFAGLTLGTTNVYVQHASTGSYDNPEYAAAMNRFRAKWSR